MLVTIFRLLALFFLFLFSFSEAYIQVMFDGRKDTASLIEALNYSAQTITTVGYGNWSPPQLKPCEPGVQLNDCDPQFHSRLLRMKALSVPFMLVGAAYFAFAIGVLVNLLTPFFPR
jgi:hypothetical protein